MFELPKLQYEYNALEPHIDAKTMEIHHTKHHQTYITKLNEAITGTEFEGKTLEEILNTSNLPMQIRNNAGGHWNHSFFWKILSPNPSAQAGGGENPEGELAEEINKYFGSFEEFKKKFEEEALSVFGSGWTWLLKTSDGLKIISTPNQDNPAMADSTEKGTQIIGLDVWEHAYYLKYQNKRLDYIKAFWNVVNWGEALDNFKK